MPDLVLMPVLVAASFMVCAGVFRWVEGFVMRAILVYGGVTLFLIGSSTMPVISFVILVLATGSVLLFAIPAPRHSLERFHEEAPVLGESCILTEIAWTVDHERWEFKRGDH